VELVRESITGPAKTKNSSLKRLSLKNIVNGAKNK